MINFNNKTVIVTGGTRGIGFGIAKKFVELGANIVINYVNPNTDVEKIKKELNYSDDKLLIIQANIKNMDECANLYKQSIEKFGSVDILVNNAGITKDMLFARMKEEDFNSVIEVNLNGTFNMSKQVIRGMAKNKFGRIINISSVVALSGNKGQSNYVASKAGVIGLSKSLALEYGAKNVTVNVVAPGFIETDMTNKLPDEVKDTYLNSIPMRKMGNVNDIANSVVFLASDMANYITGQVLSVNGGLHT